MKTKLVLIIAAFVICALTACNSNTSPIVGSWERVDVKTDAVQIFSANNNYQIKNNNVSINGKYELKDNVLKIVLIDEKTGKENPFDSKYKVVELNESTMVLEQTDGVKQTYKKITK